MGTVGLKAYGINQFIEGDGFKTNGVATGIRITASNFTGRLPGAIAPEVNLSNVDINVYNSGIESNGMEILGNYLELQPSAQPKITLNKFSINVNGSLLRLNKINSGAIATWGGKIALNDGQINFKGDGHATGCSSLGVRCTTAGVLADGGSIIGSNSDISLNNVEINATGNEIGGVYAIGRVIGGDP